MWYLHNEMCLPTQQTQKSLLIEHLASYAQQVVDDL